MGKCEDTKISQYVLISLGFEFILRLLIFITKITILFDMYPLFINIS